MKVLVILIASLVIMPAISIVSMIYGYGLEVQSWPWIIGGWALIVFIQTAIASINE
jgi:hypothetical protein